MGLGISTRKHSPWRMALVLAMVLLWLSGCNRRAQLLYMADVQGDTLASLAMPRYRLNPGDLLSVNVFTQDERTTRLFNVNSSSYSYNSYSSDMLAYVNGYMVSDSGSVSLPVVGEVPVAGLTVRQAQDAVQAKVNDYLSDAQVFVKILSFKVTVIGEVKRPGTYTNYKENLNIFEALALAGDFSDYGERSNVLVLRPTDAGTRTYRLNLHDKGVLRSEAFYLLPNDTVIVEPRRGKVFALNAPNISIFLSIITTAVLIANFLVK
ncbi:MAG: polysaccharide export protein [Bacteroidales bacterium]|nr:polysaccharide export protein [Bacteroidales bacterium]